MVTYTGWPVFPAVNGVNIDRCKVALPVEITHGRSSVYAQPDAPTLKFTYLGSVAPAKVGDSLHLTELVQWTPATYDSATVDYDDSAAVYDDDGTGQRYPVRFVGIVASVTANEDQGQVTSWEVEGVGILARLGFAPVAMTRPLETDVQRVTALAGAGGIGLRVLGTSTLMLAADTIEDTDYLAALHDICKSSAGLVWQSPDGWINYGTANHREGKVPAGVLPCEAIADGLVWASAQEQIINEVTVKWAGGESTHQDLGSIAQPWGLRHVNVDTECASEVDAEALAVLILARRAWPYWGTPETLVHGHEIDAEGERLMSLLDVSTALLAPFQPVPGAVPSELAPGTVEGWVERWDTEHTWQVAMSDANRWIGVRLRTYQEVKDTFATYADALAAGTYLDLSTTREAA